MSKTISKIETPIPQIPNKVDSTKKTMLSIIMLGVVVLVILPLIPMIMWAFSERWLYPTLLPENLSLRPWRSAFRAGSNVFSAFRNSLLIAAVVTFVSTCIGIPAGRALGMHTFRFKTLAQFFILAPSIIPGLAVTMGMHIVFIKIGLSDSVVGVMLVHLLKTIPYMTIALTGVFANYNPEFEEQARILGANKTKTFFLITIPAIAPGIITGGLFAFIISWGEYIMTVLIGGGRVITMPLLLFSFVGSGDNGMTSTLGIIFLLPTIILLIFSAKYLSQNAAGSVNSYGK
ncbi:MAG: ABC transporter permease [Bacteroidetes bacterium]|nr:ABC transporter permease [Bacteroidota bacterium]